jgi:hypothetical protein
LIIALNPAITMAISAVVFRSSSPHDDGRESLALGVAVVSRGEFGSFATAASA